MKNKFTILLLSAFPIFGLSQSYISADSANKIIMNGGNCDRRIFTRIETPPSLKISKQEFIDSISKSLKLNGTSIADGKIKLKLLVDCHSKISIIQKISGDSSDADSIKASLLESSSLWLPGRQNNYIASSYIQLEMDFKDSLLVNFKISQ